MRYDDALAMVGTMVTDADGTTSGVVADVMPLQSGAAMARVVDDDGDGAWLDAEGLVTCDG